MENSNFGPVLFLAETFSGLPESLPHPAAGFRVTPKGSCTLQQTFGNSRKVVAP